MRTNLILVFCLSLIMFSFRKPATPTIQYKLIPDSSLVVWYCQENNSMHSGSFMFVGGSFTIENNLLTAGNFELDMKSLVDNDLRNADQNITLVNRLKSTALFNTADYPRARFIITKAVHLSGQQYELEANMTIKGRTRPVRMQIAIALKDGMLGIVSTDMLIEGVQFGLKTGLQANPAETDLKNFKIKISQLYASKISKRAGN